MWLFSLQIEVQHVFQLVRVCFAFGFFSPASVVEGFGFFAAGRSRPALSNFFGLLKDLLSSSARYFRALSLRFLDFMFLLQFC